MCHLRFYGIVSFAFTVLAHFPYNYFIIFFQDAQNAVTEMNGTELGSKQIFTKETSIPPIKPKLPQDREKESRGAVPSATSLTMPIMPRKQKVSCFITFNNSRSARSLCNVVIQFRPIFYCLYFWAPLLSYIRIQSGKDLIRKLPGQ